jgi:hypothetical protein
MVFRDCPTVAHNVSALGEEAELKAQTFISALHRQFWLGAVMCRFYSNYEQKRRTDF